MEIKLDTQVIYVYMNPEFDRFSGSVDFKNICVFKTEKEVFDFINKLKMRIGIMFRINLNDYSIERVVIEPIQYTIKNFDPPKDEIKLYPSPPYPY